MFVSNEMLTTGQVVLLPKDWQKVGTAAFVFEELNCRRLMDRLKRQAVGEGPSPFMLAVEADTERAVLRCVQPQAWTENGFLGLKAVPGSPNGEPLLCEVPADFDVVELSTGTVLATARRAA